MSAPEKMLGPAPTFAVIFGGLFLLFGIFVGAAAIAGLKWPNFVAALFLMFCGWRLARWGEAREV